MYIIPRHQLEEAYEEGRFEQMWGINANLEEIAGLGPFRLIDYRNGERVLLRRNPHYWKVDSEGRRLPYLDELIFMPVRDYNATMLRFTSGESHLLDPVRPGDVSLLEDESKQKNFTVYDLGTDVATNFIWFNLNPGYDGNNKPYVEPYKRTWFENQKFRRAFSHTVT